MRSRPLAVGVSVVGVLVGAIAATMLWGPARNGPEDRPMPSRPGLRARARTPVRLPAQDNCSLSAAMHEARFTIHHSDGRPALGGTVEGNEVMRASHPRQRYSAEFTREGARIEAQGSGWSLGLELVAFGAEGEAKAVGEVFWGRT